MYEEKEQPICRPVLHCGRVEERESYKVGLELPDSEFLMETDKALAEKRLDEMLGYMRTMFMTVWDCMRD
jgi:hypothetical protein